MSIGTREMTIGELLPGSEHGELRVTGISADSRRVGAGELFIALQGARHDANAFLPEVARRGAAAALVDAARPLPASPPLPLVPVDGLAGRAGAIAARFYGDPSRAMTLIGVTGTNGKTTCTQLIAQALSRSGTRCGVIGTLGTGFVGELQESTHTTPDAVMLQRLLAQMRDAGAQAVAMEVSSHALAQGRVAALRFETAVFTNLTHDHLDYHGSLEAYADAKEKLFHHPGLRRAVVSADDPMGRRILAGLPAGVEGIPCSPSGREAQLQVLSAGYDADGIRARLRTPQGEGLLAVPLIGRFNLENALLVLGVLLAHGFGLAPALEALSAVRPVSGRMQRVRDAQGPLVVVDYAHTPDALEQALRALRVHCRGRLWCVFGCGGDRDRSKRPLMGRIAREHADEVAVTSDNPRSEDPAAIIAEICAGIPDPGVIREADRRAAIFRAIGLASPADCVLVAGKGHEDYQETAGERRPFSDLQVASDALAAREGRA
ncbi:MAG: UDP-N-acetylmuramoyl-L-alanyl-D-glutamate--2,6-diaminopimelate ligase [Gammaproteobacteria bacterium]